MNLIIKIIDYLLLLLLLYSPHKHIICIYGFKAVMDLFIWILLAVIPNLKQFDLAKCVI